LGSGKGLQILIDSSGVFFLVVSLADLPEEDTWLAKQKATKHPPCLQARRRTFHAHADDPLTTSPGEPPGRHLGWLSLEEPSTTNTLREFGQYCLQSAT
jgi:hypothetical protein